MGSREKGRSVGAAGSPSSVSVAHPGMSSYLTQAAEPLAWVGDNGLSFAATLGMMNERLHDALAAAVANAAAAATANRKIFPQHYHSTELAHSGAHWCVRVWQGPLRQG